MAKAEDIFEEMLMGKLRELSYFIKKHYDIHGYKDYGFNSSYKHFSRDGDNSFEMFFEIKPSKKKRDGAK
jgi:hypothetical protein